MTRWTFYLLTDNEFLSSLEFNWEMFPDWYWNEALEKLSKVKNKNDFYKTIEDFNKAHHNYDDEKQVYIDTLSTLWKYKNMTKGYFDYWLSDWIFIKNIRKTNYTFILENNTKYTLKPWKTFRLYFWNLVWKNNII